MPTYEYKCKDTDILFTYDRRLSDEEMEERHLKRVWSAAIVWPLSERGH